MHETSRGVYSSTVPMQGLQYLASPSLTSSLFKLKANSTVGSSTEEGIRQLPYLKIKPKSSSALHDTSTQDNLSHTLSGLGPSARRLLLLDSADSGTVKKEPLPVARKIGTSNRRLGSSRCAVTSPKPAEVNGTLHSVSSTTQVAGNDGLDKNQGTGSTAPLSTSFPHKRITICNERSAYGRVGPLSRSGRTLFSTLHVPDRVKSGFSSKWSLRSKKERASSPHEHPEMSSSLTHSKRASEPVLVHDLRRYLDRELLFTRQSGALQRPVELLGPYREAFGALVDAFPGYSGILCDIRTAYDNVIQFQAELLSEAHAREELAAASGTQHREDLIALQQAVSLLQKQLESAETDLEERKKAEESNSSHQNSTRHRVLDIFELRRSLEQAQSRIREMERTSKEDLEKIVVLVGTVRECDRRMKDLESSIEYMSRHITELNEFKQLAGEAQSELQRYREKYSAFVAASDFESMKEYLISEVEQAKAMIRRMRRSVAVRGTQVDIMNRRVLHLEAVRRELDHRHRKGGPDEGEGGDGSSLLTPRPDWAAVHAQLPELAAYTKDVHCAPLVRGGPPLPKAKVAVELLSLTERLATGEEGVREADLTLPVVRGPIETSLQVEYLVERVRALTKDLERVREEKEALRRVAASCRSSTATDAIGAAKEPLVVHPATMPILGCGLSERQLRHQRATGLVERAVLEQGVSTKIIFDFFSDVMQPVFNNTEALSGPDFSPRYHQYLVSLLEGDNNKTFQAYPCATHLALNLEADAHDPISTTAPLLLLSMVLHGAMPPRLCVDAVSVVNHVKDDLTALAAEQQKAKLQRQAISECIQPVLELKSPDEVEALRAALGSDGTFDVATLTSLKYPFALTLFSQACQDGMDFYVSIVKELTSLAENRYETDGDRLISLRSMVRAITNIEPCTPVVVLRELSEDAVLERSNINNGQRHPKSNPLDSADGDEVMVRLSDVIRVIAEAPLLRRSPKLEPSGNVYML